MDLHEAMVAALLVLLVHAEGAAVSMEFYMHDNFGLTPKTVIKVAGDVVNGSSFGAIQVIDDPLTRGSLLSSEQIGRGQGTYMSDRLDGNSLLLTFTAVFSSGDDNGSTLSFHGADDYTVETREIAVIGGTGKYRMARGYALISTTSNTNLSTILHFNVTLHVVPA